MSDGTESKGRGEDLVVTPGGLRPRGRVHQVGPGEAVRVDAAGNRVIVPQRQPAELHRLEELVVTPGGPDHWRPLAKRGQFPGCGLMGPAGPVLPGSAAVAAGGSALGPPGR
jgi:hypothetical protein